MRLKHGDTLIEVTIAVGIFSMIAVAVVSVISGSTSNAQISLETTITREQIDAQAEALRFIHGSYISTRSNQDNDTKYTKLWEEITKNAKSSTDKDALNYFPNTCSELYDGGEKSPIISQNAFILDPNNMDSSNIKDILHGAWDNKNAFTTADTYPRLVYANDDGALLNNNTESKFSRAEGLYIVAVRDNGTTPIVSDKDTTKATSAYYNFYIRSCWYGPGAERPSTISTVVRLYDPEAIAAVPLTRTTPFVVRHYTKNVRDNFYTLKSTETKYTTANTTTVSLDSIKGSIKGFTYKEASFVGGTGGSGGNIIEGGTIQIAANGSTSVNLFYRPNVLIINFNANGGQLASTAHSTHYKITSEGFIWTDYENAGINFIRGAFGTPVGHINNWNDYTVSSGLINPSDPSYINLVRDGYRIDSSGAWYCKDSQSGTTAVFPQGGNSGLMVVDLAKKCGIGDLWSPNIDNVKVTLYANWINGQGITIAFDPNGGTGSMPNQTIPSGLNGNFNANIFTRNGYRFVGWCTKPVADASECSGTGVSYFDDGASFDANATLSWAGKTLTLYAIWKGQMTIAFDPNGGTGSMPNQTIDSGSSGSINSNTFTRNGWIFVGWCTKPVANASECNGAGVSYFDNEATIGAGATQSWAGKTLTLYALWRK